jgi:uncharacterized protein YneF (UPF0154 family)
MKTKKFLPLLLACILVALMVNGVSKVCASGLTFASVSGKAPLYYIPVTLTNNQDTATPINFQQQITIDSDTNTADYASNLDNVNWQDGTGNILDSWLESGMTNTANASVYWVNLGSRTIAANGGTLTIYEVIYATSVNCMNTANTGAEPNYTSTYAQYDTGYIVFQSFYDNFNGTSLSAKWQVVQSVSGGGYTEANGITVHGSGSGWEILDTVVSNLNPQATNADWESYFTGLVGAGSLVGIQLPARQCIGWYSTTSELQYCIADLSSTTLYCLENWNGGNPSGTTISGGSTTTWNIWNIWATSSASYASLLYGSSVIWTGEFTASTSLHLYIQSYTSAYNIKVQWVRVRLDPPSGVMPTVMISAPISTSALNLVLSVIIILAVLLALAVGVFFERKRTKAGRKTEQQPSSESIKQLRTGENLCEKPSNPNLTSFSASLPRQTPQIPSFSDTQHQLHASCHQDDSLRRQPPYPSNQPSQLRS